MDTTTTLAPQRVSGIPDTLRLDRRPARTSLLDRVALHIGLRLLIWSSRAPHVVDRDRHRRVFEHERARIAREHDHYRAALFAPRR